MSAEHAQPSHPHTEPPGPGHETADLPLAAIVKFGVAFAAFIIASHLIMAALFKTFEHDRRPPVTPYAAPIVQVEPAVIGPRLEVSPSKNWDEMHDAQDRLLHSYGWVNPQAGIVRVPIERAMQLALQRGFPVRASATQPANSAGTK